MENLRRNRVSELYEWGGFIGFVNPDQISWRTRPYKNYDDTIYALFNATEARLIHPSF